MIFSLLSALRHILKDASLGVTSLPRTPGIRLHLLSGDYPKHRYSSEEARIIMEEPPYWAFCWASGQVLAKVILENQEHFRDKVVLDFGAGSGVGAIAAALAGARRAIALDIDPLSLTASAANGALNGVTVEVLDHWAWEDMSADVILAADVLYDRENLSLLEPFHRAAPLVLIADSRVKDLSVAPYIKIEEAEATTCPDLGEPDEFNLVSIYQAGKLRSPLKGFHQY
jgi:predicted nicotinamide N-methyase